MDLIGFAGLGAFLMIAPCLLPLALTFLWSFVRSVCGKPIATGFRRAAIPILAPAAYVFACFLGIPFITETCTTALPAAVGFVCTVWGLVAFGSGCREEEESDETAKPSS
ncbi:MAG TPA: hypothetical protein VGP72_26465 [Planctomycetota bacterium]|jgi:hypothetical protein